MASLSSAHLRATTSSSISIRPRQRIRLSGLLRTSKLNQSQSPRHLLREPSSQVSPGPEQLLRDKSAEQLVAIICDMQETHAQQIADLEARYCVASSQVKQMTKLLNAYFKSQEQGRRSVSRELSLITAVKPSTASFTVPGPSIMASISASQGLPSSSLHMPPRVDVAHAVTTSKPQSVTATQREILEECLSSQAPGSCVPHNLAADATLHGRVELKIIPSVITHKPPTVKPSRLETVLDVWQEYCYGHNGNPSLESLDALWGARWRPDQKLRLWYGRRKAILDQIKTYMADGIDEDTAVAEVEKLRRGRTLNWLSRILLDDRKQTKKQRKEAQKAATAAKQAMESTPVA
ncbi:transcriptional activator of glycolytic enzymes-domain-containing protein [Coniella lustricola]|uniref:Transcriptional activator of glycolytic enzymes-domain-containing protein n=1 Tax=Coniella lustricola TaxID=2025994 RepID=A0A2T2ZWP4_9PEZI|nr:transcriptional activator of glycolytic enzymes-domain-containing protein [Coniella lustricola]